MASPGMIQYNRDLEQKMAADQALNEKENAKTGFKPRPPEILHGRPYNRDAQRKRTHYGPQVKVLKWKRDRATGQTFVKEATVEWKYTQQHPLKKRTRNRRANRAARAARLTQRQRG